MFDGRDLGRVEEESDLVIQQCIVDPKRNDAQSCQRSGSVRARPRLAQLSVQQSSSLDAGNRSACFSHTTAYRLKAQAR